MPATQIHHRLRKPSRVYLKEWREHRQLSQDQLAERLDTSKSVVSKLETGAQRYNQDWLEAIAFALSCEVQDLYRPPDAPTANELLQRMTPEARETAMKVLADMAEYRTGTKG